tara:strand:+ start:247 stop:354 length:108 start_codon:yes stop_codon:yes gene_type:complete
VLLLGRSGAELRATQEARTAVSSIIKPTKSLQVWM